MANPTRLSPLEVAHAELDWHSNVPDHTVFRLTPRCAEWLLQCQEYFIANQYQVAGVAGLSEEFLHYVKNTTEGIYCPKGSWQEHENH